MDKEFLIILKSLFSVEEAFLMDITMKNTLVNEFTFKSSFKVQNGIMTASISPLSTDSQGYLSIIECLPVSQINMYD